MCMVDFRHLRIPPDAVDVDPEEMRRLPASAQRVFQCILEQGRVAHGELHAITRIPPRTVRFAIRRLRDEQMIEGRLSLRDCRTCYFFVHPRLVSQEHIDEARRGGSTDELQLSVHRDA